MNFMPASWLKDLIQSLACLGRCMHETSKGKGDPCLRSWSGSIPGSCTSSITIVKAERCKANPFTAKSNVSQEGQKTVAAATSGQQCIWGCSTMLQKKITPPNPLEHGHGACTYNQPGVPAPPPALALVLGWPRPRPRPLPFGGGAPDDGSEWWAESLAAPPPRNSSL